MRSNDAATMWLPLSVEFGAIGGFYKSFFESEAVTIDISGVSKDYCEISIGRGIGGIGVAPRESHAN